MFKTMFLATLALYSFASLACLSGESGARKMYLEEWGTEQMSSTSLQVDKSEIKNIVFYKITNPDSCGLRGCDYLIVSAKDEECLIQSLNVSGQIIIPNPKDWSALSVKQKPLPVDNIKPSKKDFKFNVNNQIFEEASEP